MGSKLEVEEGKFYESTEDAYGGIFNRYPDGKTPFGNVEKVILTTNIMHCGWEMDEKACFVALEDGRSVALTTNHGSLGILGGMPQLEGTSVPTETVFAEVKINICGVL